MSEKRNIFILAVDAMHSIFTVALEKLEDKAARDEILGWLGYEGAVSFTVPAEAHTRMESIGQFVKLDDSEITIEAFAEVMDDIIFVSEIIDTSIHLLSSDTPEEAIDETINLFLQLCILSSMQRGSYKIAGTVANVARVIMLLSELPVAYPVAGTIGIFGGSLLFLKRLFQSIGQNNKDWAKGAEKEWAAMNDTEWNAAWQALSAQEKERLANRQIKLFSNGIFFAMVVGLYFIEAISSKMRVTYGFDPPGESSTTVGEQISERAFTFSFSDKLKDTAGTEAEISYYLSMALRSQLDIGGTGLELALAGQGKLEYALGKGWKLFFTLDGIPAVDAKLEMRLEKESQQNDVSWIWGDSKGTRMVIGQTSATSVASIADRDMDTRISFKDCSFVVARNGSDGFLQSLIPEKGIEASFDLIAGFSFKKRIYVDGGSGISVFIPLHTEIGPVMLDAFYLKGSGDPSGNGFLLETSIGFTANIMGITASIQQVGLQHRFAFPEGPRNLRFVDYSVSLKPPTMIGLSVNTAGFTGGGFIGYDAANKEYIGALELSFRGVISLKAIAIINTQNTPAGPDYSMLIMISAEFNPWQIGMGFTLNGFGGLIGIHRTVRLDVLREGLKTNAFKSILFPENIVANIARIVSDLKQVFPPDKDNSIFCPLVKIGWGTPTLITIEAGLLLESNPVLFGVMRAKFPDENNPVLILQVNFLGIFDFDRNMISLDASLYDSHLLTLTLSGDFAFRLGPGTFLISVGGFHPAFNPREIPEELQHMQRITISLLSGENPRATLQCYFAITSNTVQFGAKAELYAAASGFNVYGYVAFDVIFRLVGTFEADFEAGLALRRNSSVIMGIRVSGTLGGTQPWDLKGSGSISFFFFSISVPFHVRWGEVLQAAAELTEDLLAVLLKEINADANWVAAIPSKKNLHVSVRKPQGEGSSLVIHPFGVLTFSQTVLPLEIDIDRFGNKVPRDAKHFDIKLDTPSLTSEPVKAQFAAGNFLNMNDAEKLARPSFEQMTSGFRITGSSELHSPQVINKPVTYEFSYLGRKKRGKPVRDKYGYNKDLFKGNTRSGGISASPLSYTNSRISASAPELVPVAEEQFAVAHTSDLKIYREGLKAGSYSEAKQLHDRLVREHPELSGQLQVVAEYELNLN